MPPQGEVNTKSILLRGDLVLLERKNPSAPLKTLEIASVIMYNIFIHT